MQGVGTIFFENYRGLLFPESSASGPIIFRNPQQRDRSFLELPARNPKFLEKSAGWPYGSAWLWKWIQRMGAVAPIPPRARSSAAPDGAPQRRIGEEKTALAPPCPVRGPEAGRHHSVFYKSDLLNSEKKIQKDLTPSSQAPASKTVPYNSPGQQPPSPVSRSPRSPRRHPRPRARYR